MLDLSTTYRAVREPGANKAQAYQRGEDNADTGLNQEDVKIF